MAKKLGIAEEHVVALVNAPHDFESMLDGIATTVNLGRRQSPAGADVTVAFFTERVSLDTSVRQFATEMPPTGALWVAWPKKSSGVRTDIVEDSIREVALPMGLVDNKVCAIDETWSGLRLVVRKERRAEWPMSMA